MGKNPNIIIRCDLVKQIKKHKGDAKKTVDSLFYYINKALLEKRIVKINSFGVFKPVYSNVKEVYNFKTKKREKLGKKLKIVFTPSPQIEKLLNERNLL